MFYNYYHQSAVESQSMVPLPTKDQRQILKVTMDQTVTIVHSEVGTGELMEKDIHKVDKTIENKEGRMELCEDVKNAVYESQGNPRNDQTKHDKHKFTCSSCSYTSCKRYLLLRHMKSHSKKCTHMCCFCERQFKTAASLQNHVNMHKGVKPFNCKHCSNAFTTSGELVRHVRYKHTLERPYKCRECDYASVESSKLRRHMHCHTGERPYQCCHCTYAASDTFKLNRHLRTHTGEKPYKCDICNKRFTQSNSLKTHQNIHNVTNKAVFSCELCPVKCSRKNDLRIHIQKLHSADKLYKCRRCGNNFPDKCSCKVHTKTHAGEKIYKCDTCPYASQTMRQLVSHLCTHTGEKPFRCDHCQMSFRQKQLLQRHINVCHNPKYVPPTPKEKIHTCHHCHKKFAHKGNLIRHMAVHDSETENGKNSTEQKKAQCTDVKNKEIIVQGSMQVDGCNDGIVSGEIFMVLDGENYVVLQVIETE